jgi:hypothetical protein
MKIKLLAVSLVLALCSTASAVGSEREAQDAGVDRAAARGATSMAAKDEVDCPRPTGSRIVRKERDGCIIGAGRSYHRRDIDSTGARDAGQVLEMLDPSIRGRR